MFTVLNTVIVGILWLLCGGFVCVTCQQCTCNAILANGAVDQIITFPCGNNGGRETTTVCWNSPDNEWRCDVNDSCSYCHQCSPRDLRQPTSSLFHRLFFDKCRQQTGCSYTAFSSGAAERKKDAVGCEYFYWKITYSCVGPFLASTTLATYTTTTATDAGSSATTTIATYTTTTATDAGSSATTTIVIAVIVGGVAAILCAIVIFIVLRKRKQRLLTTEANLPRTAAQNDNAPSSTNGARNDACTSNEVLNLSSPASGYAVVNWTNIRTIDEHDYARLVPAQKLSRPLYDDGNVPSDSAAAAAARSLSSDGDYGGVTLVDNTIYSPSNTEGDYGGVTLFENAVYN